MSDPLRPPERRTVNLPAVNPERPTAIAPPPMPGEASLQAIMAGVSRLGAGLDGLRAEFGTLVEENRSTNRRLTAAEQRLSEMEERARRTSLRATELGRQTSETDLSHDARLADEAIRRTELESRVVTIAAQVQGIVTENKTQTVILQELAKITSNPVAKAVANAVGTAILAYLAAKGFGAIK